MNYFIDYTGGEKKKKKNTYDIHIVQTHKQELPFAPDVALKCLYFR